MIGMQSLGFLSEFFFLASCCQAQLQSTGNPLMSNIFCWETLPLKAKLANIQIHSEGLLRMCVVMFEGQSSTPLKSQNPDWSGVFSEET